MNKQRDYVYILMCICIAVVGFGAGFFSKSELVDKENKIKQQQILSEQSKQSFNPDVMQTENNEENLDYYFLVSREKTLLLYQVNDEEKILLKEINFDTSSLPDEDRLKLKAGIAINSLEDGYLLIEDFTS